MVWAQFWPSSVVWPSTILLMANTRATAAPGSSVDAAIRRASAGIRLQLEQLSVGIGDAVRVASVEERAGRESTLRTYTGMLTSFLDWVESGAPTEPSTELLAFPDALALARETARSGSGVRVIMRGVRVGHQRFLELWDEQLVVQGLPSDTLSEALARSRDMTFRWADTLGEALTDEYEAERERLVRSGEAQRARAIASLLEGQSVDVGGVSRTLRYELSRTHTGFVLWVDSDDSGQEVGQRLERAAQELAHALGAPAALTLSSSTTALWAWAATSEPPDLRRLPATGAAGVSVAVGEPAAGAEGFRSTHQDALDAQLVAWGKGRRAGTVIRYGDVELAAMLVGDVARARRFVRRHLGGLATDDEETARLRATLRVYLDELGSRQATAERLGVHSNTVGNRVNACQHLLGRPLGERRVELHAALALAQTLGPPVLRRPPAGG